MGLREPCPVVLEWQAMKCIECGDVYEGLLQLCRPCQAKAKAAASAASVLGRKRHGRRVRQEEVSRAAKHLGALGASKGGKARAANMSPAERRRSALEAAKAAGESHRKRAKLFRRMQEILEKEAS